jgi:hypothetical protein
MRTHMPGLVSALTMAFGSTGALAGGWDYGANYAPQPYAYGPPAYYAPPPVYYPPPPVYSYYYPPVAYGYYRPRYYYGPRYGYAAYRYRPWVYGGRYGHGRRW